MKFCGLEGFPIQEMNQLKVDLYQKILMPLQATKDGCVRLECKGNNLRKNIKRNRINRHRKANSTCIWRKSRGSKNKRKFYKYNK